ncbi:unnamed protein product [Chondrus crispus]|uniref:Uncharacterized protein n=1 Tax=Chondrus crispus TaxID=2769 RepID=R7QJM1_CHOCR|nr:unnamed protein product [Chondrus crispus]CDF37666.1 unnamed protein product [Chondrus crispus]|eukprot:XP_005717537.1 unnamed protein product [Chondrus crispus]
MGREILMSSGHDGSSAPSDWLRESLTRGATEPAFQRVHTRADRVYRSILSTARVAVRVQPTENWNVVSLTLAGGMLGEQSAVVAPGAGWTNKSWTSLAWASRSRVLWSEERKVSPNWEASEPRHSR